MKFWYWNCTLGSHNLHNFCFAPVNYCLSEGVWILRTATISLCCEINSSFPRTLAFLTSLSSDFPTRLFSSILILAHSKTGRVFAALYKNYTFYFHSLVTANFWRCVFWLVSLNSFDECRYKVPLKKSITLISDKFL